MEIIRNVVFIVFSLVAAYYMAIPVQSFYCANIGVCSGGFFGFDLGILVWMVLVYAFSVVILLMMFGGPRKYWWAGAALIPAVLFQITADVSSIFLFLVWCVLAWLLGTLANKTLTKLAPSFMAKIS